MHTYIQYTTSWSVPAISPEDSLGKKLHTFNIDCISEQISDMISRNTVNLYTLQVIVYKCFQPSFADFFVVWIPFSEYFFPQPFLSNFGHS